MNNTTNTGNTVSKTIVWMVSQLVGFAVLAGWVQPEVATEVTQVISTLVAGLIMVTTSAIYLVGFVKTLKKRPAEPPVVPAVQEINTPPAN